MVVYKHFCGTFTVCIALQNRAAIATAGMNEATNIGDACACLSAVGQVFAR